MTPVYLQIKYFLNTIAIGLVMGIVFDFYRALRGMCKPKRWTTDLTDLLVSSFLSCLVFLLLLFSNWGEVRVYVFLGIGIGLGVYTKYCSRPILNFWINWLTFLIKTLAFLGYLFLLPVKLLKKILAIPLVLISVAIYKCHEFVKPVPGKTVDKISRLLKKVFLKRK